MKIMKKMETNKFKKGIEDIKQMRLNHSEKSALFRRIENRINQNPIYHRPVKSPWYKAVEVFAVSNIGYITAAAFVVCLVGVNTLFAVEKSLPGDSLYSLKVDVIEPLKYTMAIGPVAKANVEVDNVVNRLKEAEALESQGRLSTSSGEDLVSRLETHAKSFDALVSHSDNISSSTYATINARINFETKIINHSRILDKIEKRSLNYGKKNISKLNDVVRVEAEKATESRKKAENSLHESQDRKKDSSGDNNQNNQEKHNQGENINEE